jgi:serine/threonine-protein kinase
MAEELIGKTVGGYEIIEIVGRGGMAVVYRAHQVSMNRPVALKILPRHFLNDDTYLQRFRREVDIVSTLEHRNIVPVYDYGEYDKQPFIAMRLMTGGSVEDTLKAEGVLSLDKMIDVLSQIAPALDYAHSKDVLHRDLKPSNVLLDDNDGAYITDFGIARILGQPGSTITTQGVVGTPSYMSPEQAQAKPLDGRSDLYSLGVMLFEMATGRRPFESETPYSIAVMQVTERPPQPRLINTDLSAAIEQVILTSLRKKPEERYQTAVEMVAALKQAREDPAMFDTQPRPYQPEQTPPASSAQVVVPPPMPTQTSTPPPPSPLSAPAYTPPPPNMASSISQPRVERMKPKRRPNLLVSWVLGSVIGCGLLTVVIVVIGVALRDMIQRENMDATATAEAELAAESTAQLVFGGVTLTPALPTNTVAATRAASAATATTEPEPLTIFITATQKFTPITGVAPVGVRPTASPTPILIPITVTRDSQARTMATSTGLTGDLVYFAERDASFNIYRLNLSTLEEEQLTEVQQADSYPIASPDGTRFVFQSSRDGDFDIYVADINGGNTRRVVDNSVIDRLPDWSPDGEWIVFSSDTRNDGTFDIYRVRPDGADLELLVSNGQRNSHPRWSPDSRSIVYTTGDVADARTWEIAIYDLDTEIETLLTLNNLKDWSPNFSPDGEEIIFLTDGEGLSAIATMTTAGEDVEIVFDGSGYELGARYSPDGEYIVFSSDATGQDELYIMTLEDGDIRQVTFEGGLYGHWIR